MKHFKPEETESLSPADMGLVYTGVRRYDVDGAVTVSSGGEEVCLAVLCGEVEYNFEGRTGTAPMRDVLYLPAGSSVTLSGRAWVMAFGAPCSRKTAFCHFKFDEADKSGRHKVYGRPEQGTLRDVWNIVDESFDSCRFLVGICHGAPGGWTAWPPHMHGKKREEVYVYFDMDDGFALQCVYEDMESPGAVALVQNGHLVAIPEGYHPNVGCPKTGIRYIYCMVSVTEGDREFMDLQTQAIYGDRLE